MTAPETARAAGMRTALVPFALLVMLGVLWGLSFSLAKISTTAGVHPFGLTAWQCTGGALIVLAFGLGRRELPPVTRRHLGYYLGCAVLGIAVPSPVWFFAAPHLPAGIMSLLVATVPLMTYGFALCLAMERLRWYRVLGIALGFCAMLLILAPRASLPAPGMAGWVLFCMVAPLCYALSNIFMGRFRPDGASSLALAAGMLIAGIAMIVPLAWFTGTMHSLMPPWDAVDFAVAGQPAITGIAYILMFEVIRTSGPVFFSQVGYLVTAGGVLWGIALFGETHSPWIWAALALMFVGLGLLNLRQRAPSRPLG